MTMDLDVLARLTSFHAVVGNEEPLGRWLMEQLAPLATRVEQDRLGNVYAWRGSSPRVALFSQMDSVGFIVEEVHEGYVKVLSMGGPATPEYADMVVERDGGDVRRGTLLVEEKTVHIDLWDGEAEGVQVGDLAAFAPNFRAADGLLHSRWLDNKLGVWVALEAWKAAESAIFVATVREEHSPAGAGAALQMLPEMELAVVVDITYSSSPEGPYLVEWGKGPAITFRDANVYDRRWAKRMLAVAKEHEIPAQPEVARSGGSDARHVAAAGVPAIFVGLPIRYAHTPAEVARLSDAEHARALLLRFLERYPDGRLPEP